QRGLDIVLAIDTSRSMLVQDLAPSRLARARREVSGLLANLSGDRAALLAFAGDVREVAPLTHDRKTLSAFVNDLNTEENLQGGTNLGAAIDRALELFDGRTGAHEAILLLTDGEDLQGEGIAAAERAKEQGIKLFVVGMGSSQGGKIPNGRGGFVRDENGQEVISALDYDSLKELSRITGGTMLTTDQSPFPLQELYEKRLSKLDERDLVAGKERIPRDRYQEPLALAALLMMAEMGLRERRKRGEDS
ncbi:MAG: VWA domain-containing protein, partial [Planctomycetota bacterium]